MSGRSPSGLAGRPADQAPAGLGDTATIPNAGDVFVIVYPFVRGTFEEFGCDPVLSWVPGIRYEAIGPEDSGAVADAEGSARFTVEAVFKPGRFPTRVFYTRQFVNPDGKQFGKTKLHIATLGKFRRLTRGFRVPYGVGEPFDDRSASSSREWFERELASVIATQARGGSPHNQSNPKVGV